MALRVSKVKVWHAGIEDRPGGLARKLAALAEAGANLEFIVARRSSSTPGAGVVFVTPLKGARQTRAAADISMAVSDNMHPVRVEGPDRPGLAAEVAQAIADAEINLRGFSAAAMGRKCIMHLAFESDEDAAAATKLLRKIR